MTTTKIVFASTQWSPHDCICGDCAPVLKSLDGFLFSGGRSWSPTGLTVFTILGLASLFFSHFWEGTFTVSVRIPQFRAGWRHKYEQTASLWVVQSRNSVNSFCCLNWFFVAEGLTFVTKVGVKRKHVCKCDRGVARASCCPKQIIFEVCHVLHLPRLCAASSSPWFINPELGAPIGLQQTTRETSGAGRLVNKNEYSTTGGVRRVMFRATPSVASAYTASNEVGQPGCPSAHWTQSPSQCSFKTFWMKNLVC